MTYRNACLGILTWACLFPALVFASQPDVFFAGIAFTGSAADAEENLPITTRILAGTGHSEMNQVLLSGLMESPPSHFRIIADELATLDGRSSSIVLAATLDRETITIEQIRDGYKVLVEVAAQALFFDFRESQVLFTFPVTLQYVDLTHKSPPDSNYKETIVRHMLFGTHPESMTTVFVQRLSAMQLPSAASRRLQLTELNISPELLGRYERLNGMFHSGTIGHEFSKWFSHELGIALLPYRSGQAIGGAMAARFADGRVFNLRIPDPDYAIRLTVEDFRGRRIQETPAFRQELLGAFFRVSVVEPLSGRQYFDLSMRQGATKTIPATQPDYDEFAAYYETLLLGFSSFSGAAGGGNDEWRRAQPGGRLVARQFSSLGELVNLCR